MHTVISQHQELYKRVILHARWLYKDVRGTKN